MTEKYTIGVPCQNCKIINNLKIPIGTTILEYAKETENPDCRHCGCPVIKIKEDKKND